MRPLYIRVPPFPATLAAATLLLTGCSGGDGGGGEGASPEVEAWRLEGPGLRIGAVEDSAYAFGRVQDVAEGPDGRFFSLHFNEAAVRRWTPEGEPDGRIGREGEGPGEFTRPARLGFFGDSLWVTDARWYRASYFSSDGRLLGTVTPGFDMGSPEDGPGASPPRVERPYRGGAWYGVEPAWSDAIARGTLRRVRHVTMSAEAEVLDTIWVQDFRPTDIFALLREDGRGGTFGVQPFGDVPLSAVRDEGGMVVVDRRVAAEPEDASVRVTWIDAAGDTGRTAVLRYEPTPLRREQADSAADAWADQLHRWMSRNRPGLSLADLRRQARDAVYAPIHMPAVRDLVLAEDGSIWLQRFELDEGGDRWWVVGPDGELQREVAAPEGLRLLRIHGDRVWAAVEDELDVSYLVRYRAVPADG